MIDDWNRIPEDLKRVEKSEIFKATYGNELRERPRWTTPDEIADGSRADESVSSRSELSPERPYLGHGGLHTK